ncbi:MAG: hypothetical protein AB7P76_00425 [Candidatus Melainabacteria bacterium]
MMIQSRSQVQLMTLAVSALLMCALVTAPAARAEEETQGKARGAMSMMELEPGLDLEDPGARPAETSTDTYQAKAVVVDVSSDNLTYDQDRDVYIATGKVHVVISEQNSELYADAVTYSKSQELLIADGHVRIIKNGQETGGAYAKIDLTRKSALINDVATTVKEVRITAKQSMFAEKFAQYENGKLILSGDMLARAAGKDVPAKPNAKTKEKADPQKPAGDQDLSTLTYSNGDDFDAPDAPSFQNDPAANDPAKPERIRLHAREVNVYRWDDGYSKVDLKWPSLAYNNHKFLTLPNAQFSYDANNQETEWLGPDIGYDPDYGGFYYGPGWDFRLGEGSVRFSPLVTMGGGNRKRRGGRSFESTGNGPGVGGVVHYRSHGLMLDAGYNSRVGQPVGILEKKLFDGKTKALMSVNEDYINGFLGYERPGYGAMVADSRKLAEFGAFRVDSFESIGYFKDDFFPNNEVSRFVDSKDKGPSPENAGRIQLQAQLKNTKPLLSVGNVLSFGVRATASAAGYTTGDLVGMLRGGPTMNLRLGNRFSSTLSYNYAVTGGDTPFLFDTYYRGRQSMGLNNAVRINDYLTVGTRSNLSLLRDNAKGDLLTGNAMFVSVGPKSFKVNVAYDVIRKRSYFGVNFYPGNDSKPLHFDTLRMYDPDTYSADDTAQ